MSAALQVYTVRWQTLCTVQTASASDMKSTKALWSQRPSDLASSPVHRLRRLTKGIELYQFALISNLLGSPWYIFTITSPDNTRQRFGRRFFPCSMDPSNIRTASSSQSLPTLRSSYIVTRQNYLCTSFKTPRWQQFFLSKIEIRHLANFSLCTVSNVMKSPSVRLMSRDQLTMRGSA